MAARHQVSRSRLHPSGPIGIRAVAAAALIMTAGVLVGCGGDSDKKVPLPSSGASGGSTQPTTASAVTPEQAVQKAYADSYATARSAISQPPEKLRPFLAKYYTGKYLDYVVRSVLLAQQRELVPWGPGVVVHVNKVTIKNGDKATLDDCQDARKAGLKSERTGKVEPGSTGTDAQHVVVQLTRGGDGQWRITEARTYPKRCSRS